MKKKKTTGYGEWLDRDLSMKRVEFLLTEDLEEIEAASFFFQKRKPLKNLRDFIKDLKSPSSVENFERVIININFVERIFSKVKFAMEDEVQYFCNFFEGCCLISTEFSRRLAKIGMKPVINFVNNMKSSNTEAKIAGLELIEVLLLQSLYNISLFLSDTAPDIIFEMIRSDTLPNILKIKCLEIICLIMHILSNLGEKVQLEKKLNSNIDTWLGSRIRKEIRQLSSTINFEHDNEISFKKIISHIN